MIGLSIVAASMRRRIQRREQNRSWPSGQNFFDATGHANRDATKEPQFTATRTDLRLPIRHSHDDTID